MNLVITYDNKTVNFDEMNGRESELQHNFSDPTSKLIQVFLTQNNEKAKAAKEELYSRACNYCSKLQLSSHHSAGLANAFIAKLQFYKYLTTKTD